MSTTNPRMSIGLPVYNGENYLEQVLDSLLGQTYRDFELIISDNASTDRTQAICRAYAATDGRVRYFRNVTNLGAAKNYNRVFELSSGEYFKWAAHDDTCAPDFLVKCIDVLNRDPSVVLCYTRMIDIDEHGKHVRTTRTALAADSIKPNERFRGIIHGGHQCAEVFGVIRTSILCKTPLISNYADCDRVLLAEIGLYGRFHEVPEVLFFHRVHPGTSVRMYPGRVTRAQWYDPKLAGRVLFPRSRQFFEYLLTIKRSPLTWSERALCYLAMCGWLRDRGRREAVKVLSRIWPLFPTWLRQWLKQWSVCGRSVGER
jgi:glycosyltransferase involved in cell wall biosynthesis